MRRSLSAVSALLLSLPWSGCYRAGDRGPDGGAPGAADASRSWDAGPPDPACPGAIRISPDGASVGRPADLIADERGGLLAALDVTFGSPEVRLASYDPSSGWTASSILSPTPGWAAVADQRAGRLGLAWVTDNPDRDVVASSGESGRILDAPTVLDGPGISAWPDVAVDASGRATVAWHHEGTVVARRFDPSSGWDAPTTLSAGPWAYYPRLVASGENIVAVWLEAPQIWTRTFSDGRWGPPSRLDGGERGPDHPSALDVGIDDDGTVLVAWVHDGVWVAELAPGRAPTMSRLGDVEGETSARLAMGVGAGSVDVVWASDATDGTNIRLAHGDRAAMTTSWEPATLLATTPRPSAEVDAIAGSIVWSGPGSPLTVAHHVGGEWIATPFADASTESARIVRERRTGEVWVIYLRWVEGMTAAACATRG